MGTFGAEWEPIFAIDQSGLSVNYVSGVTDFDIYMSGNPSHSVTPFTTWFSSPGVSSGNFDIGLGGVVGIQSMALWNESQVRGQGINSFNLWADTQASFAAAVLLGAFTATEGIDLAEVFRPHRKCRIRQLES